MQKLKSLITQCKLKVLNGGKCPILSKISAEYKDAFKISSYPFDYSDKMQEAVGIKIADIYQSIQHKPNDVLVKAAYSQLIKEIIAQFEFITNKLQIDFEPYESEGEPYASSYDMLVDIHSYHMYFFKTEVGFGETEYIEKNSMLNKTGFKIGDYDLLANDLFRIVHDIFGHAMNGNSFSYKGEDSAWFAHLKMFSPLAAAALSTETRGQNCWVNFGAHLRTKNGTLIKQGEKGWVPPSERPFAEQKMNILPSFVTGIKVHEKNHKIEAKYLDFWDPFLSILNQ